MNSREELNGVIEEVRGPSGLASEAVRKSGLGKKSKQRELEVS